MNPLVTRTTYNQAEAMMMAGAAQICMSQLSQTGFTVSQREILR